MLFFFACWLLLLNNSTLSGIYFHISPGYIYQNMHRAQQLVCNMKMKTSLPTGKNKQQQQQRNIKYKDNYPLCSDLQRVVTALFPHAQCFLIIEVWS